MAFLRWLTDDEAVAAAKKTVCPGVDLTTYVTFLSRTEGWVRVELDSGETQRAVKRRITGAAKLANRKVTYHQAVDGDVIIIEVTKLS